MLAACLDLECSLVFVAIGRSVHARGVTLAGMASTSWPFVTAVALAFLGAAMLGWRLLAGLAACLGGHRGA